MKDEGFKNRVLKIIDNDSRYAFEAYEFISDAVHFTADRLQRHKQKNRHVSGRELLKGVSDYALEQFGPLAWEVLVHWGLRDGRAVGHVVFNMVEQKLLSASEEDSINDFDIDFSIEETLTKPFQPRKKKLLKAPIID